MGGIDGIEGPAGAGADELNPDELKLGAGA
jgi:hypothetical protein